MPNSKEGIVITTLLRQLTLDDIDEIVRVEGKTWPEDWQAPREKFEARLRKFPQGCFGIFEDAKLVGVTTSMRSSFDLSNVGSYQKTWDEITGDGFITTHEPQGNALYVVSVGVQADAQGKGYGQQLVAAQVELAKKLGCSSIFLGARLPKLKEHIEASRGKKFEEISWNDNELAQQAQAYLDLRRDDGQRLDPEIRFYERCGFAVAKLTNPNFGPDPDSCGFGVIVYKLN